MLHSLSQHSYLLAVWALAVGVLKGAQVAPFDAGEVGQDVVPEDVISGRP